MRASGVTAPGDPLPSGVWFRMTPPPGPLYPEDRSLEAKRCTKRKQVKPLADFAERENMRDGRTSHCKTCRALATSDWKSRHMDKVISRSEGANLVATKRCSNCGEEKSLALFEPAPFCRDGRHTQCKKCGTEAKRKWVDNNREHVREVARADPKRKMRNRQWAQNNPEYCRRYLKAWKEARPTYERTKHVERRFRNYGIDESWYAKQLAEQGGGCAVCGSCEPRGNGGTFQVDHDHRCCSSSCKACDKCRRGLLCGPCNTALGVLEDHEWVEMARRYLSTHKIETAQGTALRREWTLRCVAAYLVWYKETLRLQDSCCGICRSRDPKCRNNKFHIDHHHGCCPKGKVCDRCRRGLLCNVCNLRLGFLENEEWAAKAKVYLAKYTTSAANQPK